MQHISVSMDATEMLEEQEGVGAIATKRLYPLFVGQIFGLLITVAVLIILARMLGPAPYGLYSFAFGYQAFIDGVTAWGIGAFFARDLSIYVSKKDIKKIMETLSSGFVIAIPIGIILTLIGFAFSGIVANSWFQGIGISQSTLIIVSPISFFIIMQASIYYALVGLKRSGLGAISIVATDVVQLISIVSLVLLGYGVSGAVAGMLIGYAVGTAMSAVFLYQAVSKYGKARLPWPSKESVKHAWNFSLPLAANNFLNNGMTNFGILILGIYVTAATLGNYGAALRGLALIAVIYGTVNTVLIPTFIDVNLQTAKKLMEKAYNKVIIYAMIPVVAILVYIAVFAAPGMFVIVSGSYSTAPIFLALIAIGTLINLFGYNVASLLMARGFTKEMLFYNFYATIIELISLIVLVVVMPTAFYKVLGAIIASFFIGNIAVSILFVNGATKLVNLHFDYKWLFKLSLSTIALGLILLVFYLGSTFLIPGIAAHILGNIIELIAGFVIMVAVFPILLAVFGVLRIEDIVSIKKAVAKHGELKIVTNAVFSYMTPFLK